MAEQRRLQTLLGHLKATAPGAEASYGTGNSSNYRYTLDASCDGVLSQEQRQVFEENGFIVIKKLVPLDKLEMYRERFEQICKREVKVS